MPLRRSGIVGLTGGRWPMGGVYVGGLGKSIVMGD